MRSILWVYVFIALTGRIWPAPARDLGLTGNATHASLLLHPQSLRFTLPTVPGHDTARLRLAREGGRTIAVKSAHTAGVPGEQRALGAAGVHARGGVRRHGGSLEASNIYNKCQCGAAVRWWARAWARTYRRHAREHRSGLPEVAAPREYRWPWGGRKGGFLGYRGPAGSLALCVPRGRGKAGGKARRNLQAARRAARRAETCRVFFGS